MSVRILIVDDDEAVARMYARSLAFYGYDTVETHSYREAVVALKQSVVDQRPFALAVIDYIMPLIKGDRLARYIRRNHPEMAIIMISAYPDDHLLHDGFGIADRFVPKPLRHEEFIAIVAEVLKKKDAENARIERHFVRKVLTPASSLPSSETTRTLPGKLTVGELCLDFANQRFTLDMFPLDLSPPEIAVLTHLAAHAPHPVARARLEELVQNDRHRESSASRLTRIIHSLRSKLHAANTAANPPQDPLRDKRRTQNHGGEILKTLRGVGYYLDDASSD